MELAESVLVPNGPPGTVSVKVDAAVPTDATIALSPLTLPFPEFVGEVDKTIGARLNLGVIENPTNPGLKQVRKTADWETCIFSSSAMLLPATLIGEGKLTVGPLSISE